jgi:hypothetical protein
MLHAANLANPVNPANLIYPSIRAAAWANPCNLANPANPTNPICLAVQVTVLGNPVTSARVMPLCLTNLVNPAMVTQIFSLVRDLL